MVYPRHVKSPGFELHLPAEAGNLPVFNKTQTKNLTLSSLVWINLFYFYLACFSLSKANVAHNNADNECIFSVCRKIDTDARSQLGNDILHTLLSCKTTWMSRAMHFSQTTIGKVYNMELCEGTQIIVMCRPLLV